MDDLKELHKPIAPTAGRMVLFKSDSPHEMGHGSAQEVPAIVTHVWSDLCVNLMVMRDGHDQTPIGVTSVCHDSMGHQSHSWRWPPRV
jgi:hypothetical protein